MSSGLHEPNNLVWKLSKHLASQKPFVPAPIAAHEPVEFDELHNVSHCCAPSLLQQCVVRVKLVHGLEVLVANPDDDDRHGKVRRRDYGRLGGLHVANDAVGDDEEHLVVDRVVLEGSGKLGHMVDYRGKIGRAVQLHAVESVVVRGDDPIYAFTVGVAWGEVQEELVADSAVRGKTSPKTKCRKEFVSVIVLY